MNTTKSHGYRHTDIKPAAIAALRAGVPRHVVAWKYGVSYRTVTRWYDERPRHTDRRNRLVQQFSAEARLP